MVFHLVLVSAPQTRTLTCTGAGGLLGLLGWEPPERLVPVDIEAEVSDLAVPKREDVGVLRLGREPAALATGTGADEGDHAVVDFPELLQLRLIVLPRLKPAKEIVGHRLLATWR